MLDRTTILLCTLLLSVSATARTLDHTGRQLLHSEYEDKKIVFHFGANYEPYDFLVNEPGAPETQTGFGVELARMLCDRNGLKCVFVRDNYENCWMSGDFPGQGLLSGWYHACSTYTNTFLRQNSVQFGHSYTRERPAGILSRLDESGNPVIHPKDLDLGGKKIAVVGGWATNAASLQYLNNDCVDGTFSNYEVVTPEDEHSGPDAAVRALVNGEVDGVYLYSSLVDDRKGCTSETCDAEVWDGLGTEYAWIHTGVVDYQANGTTLAFTRKDSDLNEFLNPLLEEFLATEDYAKLCKKYKEQDIDCFPNDFFEAKEGDKNSLSNTERNELCSQDPMPADCLSCAGGHCGCEVPRSGE